MITALQLVRDFEVRPRTPTPLETALGAAEVFDVWDHPAVPCETPGLRVVMRTVTGAFFCSCPTQEPDPQCRHVEAARGYLRVMGDRFTAAFE